MSIIVKSSGNFEPAPQGPATAVCIDVVNLGTVESRFGAKPKVVLVWSLDKRMKSSDRKQLGKPYLVQKRYTASLHPKSSLRKDLESWAGKKMDEAKIARDGFDLETLIGKGCYLSIQHNETDTGLYANVVAVMPLPDGMQKPIPDPEYVRRADRSENGSTRKQGSTRHGHPAGEDEPPVPDEDDAPPPADDAEIPF